MESEAVFICHDLLEKIKQAVIVEMEIRAEYDPLFRTHDWTPSEQRAIGRFIGKISQPNPILQEVLKSEESETPLLGYNGVNREQLIADQLWARGQVANILGMVDILRITRQAFMDETLDKIWYEDNPDFLMSIDPDAYLEMMDAMSRAQQQGSS